MKKSILLSLFVFILLFVFFISCQKKSNVTDNESEINFNEIAAKEWYFNVFKKSSQWQNSVLKKEMFPDWKNYRTGKIGNNVAVEFLLIKKRPSFVISPVSGDSQLSQTQIARIAEASISKILFLKKESGNILVREIDYIPDMPYLEAQSYDIRSISVLGDLEGFSGSIITKKWNQSRIARGVFENGKLIKMGVVKETGVTNQTQRTEATQTAGCPEQQVCTFARDCILTITGDGTITNECGQWYNTGICWTETNCDGIDPCQLYGDCGGGSEPDPDQCENKSCEEVQSALASITTENLYNISYSSSSESQPDNYGIIRKAVTPKWEFFKLNFVGNYNVRYTVNFAGIVYKTTTNSDWKWETIEYQGPPIRTGLVPMCFSVDLDVTVAIPIISTDKKKANVASLEYHCSVTHPCLFGYQSQSYHDIITNQDFFANQ